MSPATLTQIDAIAFDLDGTLINSGPALAQSTALALQDLGLPPCHEADALRWIGNGAEVLIQRALSNDLQVQPDLDAGLLQQVLARFHHHYQQHLLEPAPIYPGVSQTLRLLQQRGYRLALVTNKPSAYLPAILRGVALETCFDYCLGGDSLSERKPHPMPLHHLLQQWQLKPQSLLMVGDSANDIEAAKAASCPNIALSYGYNHGQPVTTLNADLILNHFEQLLDLLPAKKEIQTQ